ncbi:MAG TPA: histone [Chlamydiales bacterium]|nr:histone [Chlamydiales bacterium]
MALKNTMKTMHMHLEALLKDLAKVEGGNKAAAQRVRTGSIKLAKIAKIFRKESVAAEKKGLMVKKPAAKKAPAKKKAPAAKKPVAKKKAPAKKKPVAKKKPAKKGRK